MPIISLKNGQKYCIDNRELDLHLANGFEVVGYYTHYSWEDCVKRYPRIINTLTGSYYTASEAACLLRDIRWFREIEPERHQKLCHKLRVYLRIHRNLKRTLKEQANAKA